MATCFTLRAALASGWVLLVATSPAFAAQPHATSKEASAKSPAPPRTGSKGPMKSASASDLGSRRGMAGGATRDEPSGLDSQELRALRDADRELFPVSTSMPPAASWPDLLLPLPAGDAPKVAATGLPELLPIVRAPRESDDMSWLDRLEMPDLPVRWDERVVRYVQFFRDDPLGHSTFATLYRHSGRWRELIRGVLRTKSLPDDLVWVAMIESGFDATAHSSAGAAGLWQFMPETAKLYGLGVDRWLDERLNANRATHAAATFLEDLHRRFGNWELALAGYSMGHVGLSTVVRRYNTNDFWSLSRTEGTLPWETTLYVPKVLAAAVVSHNLTAFGFGDLTVDAPVEADEVGVAPGTPLSVVAQAAGCPTHTIETLNPELRAGRTPPVDEAQTPYPVRVPQGKGATLPASLAKLRKDQPLLERYVVRFGETLEQVATSRKTTPQKLLDLNAIGPSEVIRGGTVLLVPRVENQAAGATLPTSGPKPTVIVPSDVFIYPGRERVFYRVVAFDTLGEVAAALGVSSDELSHWNGLDPSARLQEGMTLQAFVSPGTEMSRVVVSHEKDVHVVAIGSDEFFAALEREQGFKRVTVHAKAGDTLESVGKRFSVPPRTMERINRRGRGEPLRAGDPVVVYAPAKWMDSAANEGGAGATASSNEPAPNGPLPPSPDPSALPPLP